MFAARLYSWFARGASRLFDFSCRPNQRASSNAPTISTRPYISVAVTAGVPANVLVAMTRPTPALRSDVVRVIVLRMAASGPPSSQPAAQLASNRASIPRKPRGRFRRSWAPIRHRDDELHKVVASPSGWYYRTEGLHFFPVQGTVGAVRDQADPVRRPLHPNLDKTLEV